MLYYSADCDTSIYKDGNTTADADAVQNVLQDLMRHIILLQQSSSRRAGDLPTRDEPVRLESSITRSRVTHEDRQQQISRQLRTSEGSVAGIRQKLHDSLNAVAQHVSPLALSRESKKLDGLVESESHS